MGLIARVLEQAGLPTVVIGSCLDMMRQVKAPRAAFVDYPLGRPCGMPHNPYDQTSILQAALKLLETAREPGRTVELPNQWPRPFTFADFLQGIQDMLREVGVQIGDLRNPGGSRD